MSELIGDRRFSPTLIAELVGDEKIRRFADESIQKQIDAAVATLPLGTKGAVVAYATTTGVWGSIVAKPNEHWTVVAGAYKRFDGPLEAATSVRFTF